MGLFVMDMEELQTKRSHVKAAIDNLELYLEQNPEEDYDYLIDIASGYLDRAIELEK